MVIYSETAISDLEDILFGLVTWKKHPLEYEHAERYVDELADEIDTICYKQVHRNCQYATHQKHGEKVFRYNRNKSTQWNIIYNWDANFRIAYVNKIISNYKTISGN